MQRRIYSANIALHYFMMNDWRFINDKLFSLKLHPNDIDDFEYVQCLKNVIQRDYFFSAAVGDKKYIVKEDVSPKAQTRAIIKLLSSECGF